jgi:hypothetical protein
VAPTQSRVLEHRAHARTRDREVGLERSERCQHERPFDDSGMRHAQPLGRDRLAAVEQQVEIDGPRRPAAAVRATELALDGLEGVEQIGGRRGRAAG